MRPDSHRSAYRLGAAVVVVVALLGEGCGIAGRQAGAQAVNKGKRYLAGQDYARASLEFRIAARSRPADPEVWYLLGLASLGSGKAQQAAEALFRATALDPSHKQAQLKLAELMTAASEEEVVQNAETRLLALLAKAPADAELLVALAVAEFRLGRYDHAEAHLRRALECSPHDLGASVVLARLRLARRDLSGAEQVLKSARKEHPRSSASALALAEFYLAAGRWPEAGQQFQDLLSLEPSNAAGMLGLALVRLEQGQYATAEQIYRTLSQRSDGRFRTLHADYLLATGRAEPAMSELQQLANSNGADLRVPKRLAQAYLVSGRIPEAEKLLRATLKTNPKDTEALAILSQVLLQTGHREEAERTLAQVLATEPGSADAHYLLAKAHLHAGERFRRRQELQTAVALRPGFLQARLELAQTLIADNAAKMAVDVLNQAPEPQRRSPALILQRNWALLAAGDRARAERGIAEGLALARTPDLLLQQALLRLNSRDCAGSRSALNEVLNQHPDDVRALHLLVLSYAAQARANVGVQALQRYAAQQPKSARVQQLLGHWLVATSHPDEARIAFQTAHNADPAFGPATLALARLDVLAGHAGEARSNLAAVVAAKPGQVAPRLLLASAAMRGGDYRSAIEQYRRVVQLDARNVAALNNLAYLLAERVSADEALPFAQRAAELAPGSPDTAGTLGWVLYRKGLYAPALQQLETAVAADKPPLGRNSAIRKYHLALAYVQTGAVHRAEQALADGLRIGYNLPEADAARRAIDTARAHSVD